jgi:hypothetical protein
MFPTMNKETMPIRQKYKTMGTAWSLDSKEHFLVSYAVQGPIQNKNTGVRYDMPVEHPISGPVPNPSPLNNRYLMLPSVEYRVPMLVDEDVSKTIADDSTY